MATSICNSTRSYGLLSPQIQTFPLTRSLWAGCSINPSPSKNFFFRLHHLRKARSQSPGNRQGLPLRRNAVSCGVAVISESDFEEEVVRSDIPVLVEFVASWCGPCRLIAPAIEWASEEYKGRLKVVKIDHDLNPKLIEEYKVYGLPALILFKNGQEVGESRREGAITKVKLKEYLDSQLESVPTS